MTGFSLFLPDKKEVESLTGRKAVVLPRGTIWVRLSGEEMTFFAVLHRPGEEPWTITLSADGVLDETQYVDPGLPHDLRMAQAVRSLIIRVTKSKETGEQN